MKTEKGIMELSRDDSIYPEKMSLLDKAPEKLYLKGNPELLGKKAIAVVGSRRCSEYGKNVAMKIGSSAAANGVSIISGMAIGIDNFAHRGALKAGGNTIAVLGNGPDICYPKQHEKLYEEICDRGLIVSEFCPGTEPAPFRFPLRNRIIAALADAVIIVEARMGSGSIITAEYANAMNKPVFAVPGNITSQYSLGSNRLIAEGAMALTVIDDIFVYLGMTPGINEEEYNELSEEEKKVYLFVKDEGEVFPDMICLGLDMDPFTVNSIISVLEIKGYLDFSMGRVMVIKT